MNIDFPKFALMMKALGDESRLRIFMMLANGELCACKILEEFQMTQPTLSYHMKALCGCGLVNGRRDGKWMRYTINYTNYEQFRAFITSLEVEEGGNDFLTCGCERKAACL